MSDPPHERLAVKQEQRFRLLVESVKDYAIFILDPSGLVETWNVGAERIKGYSTAEIIGKHFSTFYPPDDVAAGKCERALAIATAEGRFEAEGWRVRKDGSRFWASATITALRSPEGALTGFAKVTRDLTERKLAQDQATRFRLLVESVKDYAIFLLDPDGLVVTWNIGAERIKGYASEEIVGKHFSTFYPSEDVLCGKCDRELAVAAAEGRFEEEGWRVRKDGTQFWASVTITAIRSTEGSVTGFAKVTRDLSERVRSEEIKQQLAAESAALAEKARIQEFQERFLAILGHDLRSPLSAIDMGAALIRDTTNCDARAIPILDRVQASTRRMSRMIEQILDLTRSRLARGIEIQPARVELSTLLREIVDELVIAHPTVTMTLQCPDVVGSWDSDRLGQVFSNLIGNAIHHGGGDRRVTITARLDGAHVEVDVHNEGIPIPVALRAEIFNPFRRGKTEGRTAHTAGLGLGLYISREIALAHGGDIEVTSSLADGTTFRVTLPLASVPRG